MSLAAKFQSLTSTLAAEALKRVAEKQAEADLIHKAAAAWDAMTEKMGEASAALPVPHLLCKISGRTVVFMKDVTPDSALALLRACPPTSGMYHYRGNGTAGFRKAEHDKRGPVVGETVTPADGVTMSVSRTANYPTQTLIEWDVTLGEVPLSMRVEMRNIHGTTPEITGRVTCYNDGETIAKIEHQRLELPLGHGIGVQVQTYGSGSAKQWNSYVIWGHPGSGAVQNTLQAMADKLDEQGRMTLAAYAADKARAEAGTLPLMDADGEKPYALQSLRAGTRAQFDALRTSAALIDKSLAAKHWPRYADDHGIKTTQGYFDHYGWACAYLERVGLLRDPGLIIKCTDGKARAYKYGSAWLPTEAEQAKQHAETLAAIEAGTMERGD
jgi:hypothetical protein